MKTFKYNYRDFEFVHQIKTNIQHTYVQVHPDGQIILKSPPISKQEVFKTIKAQSKWIYNQLEKVKNLPYIRPPDEGFLYMGKLYDIKFEPYFSLEEINVIFRNFQFKIMTPTNKKPSKTTLHKAIDEFYLFKCKEKIEPIISKWSKNMNLFPQSLVFKKQKSRWGSCTSKGKILLNYQMIKLPVKCIELIIVHELVHLQIHNHSKDFWNKVEENLPDFRIRKEELKQFSILYQNYFN